MPPPADRHGPMRLSGIHVYPLKSAAGIELADAVVERRGLRHDRRWMAVDAGGKCVTGRELPRLTLVRATPAADGLLLEAPGMPRLHAATRADAATLAVDVWKSRLRAPLLGAEADAWLSTFLGTPLRLVHMDAAATRAVTSPRAMPGDVVSFADAFPVLLLSQASLDGLNARLASPVSMQRFRPNLVVDGVPAHAEDGWARIRIGEVEFEVAEPCVRCVFTTVDPVRGERDPGGEPLRTLVGYRRTPDGVAFGQLLLPRSAGTVRRGDRVDVLR